MLHLRGSAALSAFRKEKLLAQLRARVPSLAALDAVYLHIAELEKPLSGEEQAILEQLLTYGPTAQVQGDGPEWLVIPRPGTISPWSSTPPTL